MMRGHFSRTCTGGLFLGCENEQSIRFLVDMCQRRPRLDRRLWSEFNVVAVRPSETDKAAGDGL
jgi:hypothetical protein